MIEGVYVDGRIYLETGHAIDVFKKFRSDLTEACESYAKEVVKLLTKIESGDIEAAKQFLDMQDVDLPFIPMSKEAKFKILMDAGYRGFVLRGMEAALSENKNFLD